MQKRKYAVAKKTTGTLPGFRLTAAAAVIILFAAGLIAMKSIPAASYAFLFITRPLKNVTVVIDPSHGGIDPGVHYNEVITEKEVVLKVALFLRRLLEKAGATVIMTRERDEDISYLTPNGPDTRYRRDLESRVTIINESNADLFLSLHVNSCQDPDVRGAIVFYSNNRPDNKFLAETLQENINPVVRINPQPHQLFHQEIKEGSYYILNNAKIPGVLVEFAFMTSPDDRELLVQEKYQVRIAQALFNGLMDYLAQ